MLSHTLQGNLSVQYIVKQSYSIQFYMNTHLFQNSPPLARFLQLVPTIKGAFSSPTYPPTPSIG